MLVSVVMAVYNGQDYLQEAVESILRQTYPEIEFVVVDDASTDGTKQILSRISRRISDKRIKTIHLTANKGAAFALNLGIEQAKGQWIAIHDADDVSYRWRIETQVNYLRKHPDVVAAGSFIKCIRGKGNCIPEINLSGLENLINRNQTSEDIKSELYRTCPLTHGSMLFSRKAFMVHGQYNSNFKVSYDYDLWTRLITAGKIVKIPEVLYK